MSTLAQQATGAFLSASVPTPCIGVCELDAASGLCRGCARTVEEVTDWQQAEDTEKAAIWERLPERRAELSMGTYRLPWSAGDIAAMIECSLQRRSGRWVLGVPGASVAFEIAPKDDAEILIGHTEITAVTSKGALRLLKHEKTIAVAFGDKGDGYGPEAIGLILPRGRVALRKTEGISYAGTDDHAICAAHRQAKLFDLGFSPELAARFCVRTDDSQLANDLSPLRGSHWQMAHQRLAERAASSQFQFVVESGLGRAETFTPLAEDLNRQTHGEMRELPNGWALKPVFAPCAWFYPASRRAVSASFDGPF